MDRRDDVAGRGVTPTRPATQGYLVAEGERRRAQMTDQMKKNEEERWRAYHSAILKRAAAKADGPGVVDIRDLFTDEQWAELMAGQAERKRLAGIVPFPSLTDDMTDEQKEEAVNAWMRQLQAQSEGRPVDPDLKRAVDEAVARGWEHRLEPLDPDVKQTVRDALARRGEDEVLPPPPTSSDAEEWKAWAAKVGTGKASKPGPESGR
jgi:hypothetical protein